ncbi:MAG: phosphate regulon sensor protein PhoR, partial [Burkholderiales bacterium]
MVAFWIQISFYLLGIGAIAWFFGAVVSPNAGWTVAVALLAYWVVYQLYYLQKTMQWLEDFRLEKVPHGAGTWDLIFAKIYRIAKSGEQQRQQLAETLKDFRSATQAMPDGVVTLDEDNQVIYANEQAEEQLGISNEKDGGRNLINIVRHPDFVAYLNGTDWDKSIVLRGLRDSERVLQLQLIPYGTHQRL